MLDPASISFLLHPLGYCQGTPHQQMLCKGYNLWSGAGSDIGEITLITGMIVLARRLNCHTKGCWRIAKHPVEGTPYKVCSHCHPLVPDGGARKHEIHEAHRNAITPR